MFDHLIIGRNLATEKEVDQGIAAPLHFLLHAVNWDVRWSYRGSLTYPSCKGAVQHNILKTVLPITKEQMQAIKDYTESQAAGFYSFTDGNWRETQDLTDQADAVLIVNEQPDINKYRRLFVIFLWLFIATLVLLTVACYLYTHEHIKLSHVKNNQYSLADRY